MSEQNKNQIKINLNSENNNDTNNNQLISNNQEKNEINSINENIIINKNLESNLNENKNNIIINENENKINNEVNISSIQKVNKNNINKDKKYYNFINSIKNQIQEYKNKNEFITQNEINISSSEIQYNEKEEEEEENEKIIFPSDISLEEIIQITTQMKNGICFIEEEQEIEEEEKEKGEKKICTGFLCKIFYPHKTFNCLITSDEIINENYLKTKDDIILNFDETNGMEQIKLNNKKITYFNNKYGISIIEINDEDFKIKDFLELDYNMLKTFEEKNFVYIPHYKQSKKAFISFGKIEEIEDNEIIHFYNTDDNINGLLGAPILDLEDKKLIGIYSKEKKENGEIFAIFLYPILKDFIENYLEKSKFAQIINKAINENQKIKLSNDLKGQITLKLNLPKESIGQGVFILNNCIEHQNEELNKDNIEIEINGEKVDFCKSFIPKKSMNIVIIKFKKDIENCSYMFYNCTKID